MLWREASTTVPEIAAEHFFEGSHGGEEVVTWLLGEFGGSGEPVADGLVDGIQEIVLLEVRWDRVVFELGVAELTEAATDAEIGVDNLGRGWNVAPGRDVPTLQFAIHFASALRGSREAHRLLLQGVGGLGEQEFEPHLLETGFETLASKRVFDVGVVTLGLGDQPAHAGDDLRDAALIEAVNLGDFVMGVVFEGDFFEDGEVAGTVFRAARGDGGNGWRLRDEG